MEKAKQLLGWLEETDGIKLGGDKQPEVHLKDMHGKKVHLSNDTTNRPIDWPTVELLSQEILRKRWRLNGETIIIGKSGCILDGQHTLIALIIAGQRYELKPGQYAEWWKTEPTLEKVVVRGITEDDETVNTINTGRPRSLADVMYRSEFFKNTQKGTRKKLAKIADNAIRLMWHRTGAGMDAFSPRRTHAESVGFLYRHESLLQCIHHIHAENDENRIGKFIGPGFAAALMYLQAACATEAEHEEGGGYFQTTGPTEAQLDLRHMDKAEEFWTLFASGDKSLQAVRSYLAELMETRGTVKGAEKLAVFVNAWNLWSAKEAVTLKEIALEFETDEEGFSVYKQTPIVGGVDIGKPIE